MREPPAEEIGGTTASDENDSNGNDSVGLRERSVSSGLVLMMRETLGLTIRLGGLLIVTRLLGPDRYGVYAGAAALAAVLTFLAQLSLETYLIRMPTEPSKRTYDEAFTLLVLSSGTIIAAGLAVTAIFPGILSDHRMLNAFRVLLLSILPNVLWAPAQARLERAFRYRELALLEVTGDIILYGVSIVGVMAGLSYWAPIVGTVVWQFWLLIGSMTLARYFPALHLSRAALRDQLNYGVRYVGAVSVWLARTSLNPLFVGHALGTAAVGLVSLAIQITESLNAFSRVAWRIASVSTGRLQNETARLARAVRDNISAVLLSVGPIMVTFMFVAPVMVRFFFGPAWDPVVPLLPLFCSAALVSSAGNIGTIMLTTKDRMGNVAAVQLVRIVLLLAAAPILLHVLKLRGYALAECVSLTSYVLLAVYVRRVVPGLTYGFLAPLLLSFIPPLFWYDVPTAVRPLLLAPAAVSLAVPAVRRQLAFYLSLAARALPGWLPVPARLRAPVGPASPGAGAA